MVDTHTALLGAQPSAHRTGLFPREKSDLENGFGEECHAMRIRSITKQLCPPLFWEGLRSINKAMIRKEPVKDPITREVSFEPTSQDLAIYWDPEMAHILESWGIGTAWHEIQLLLANCTGKVLDIACGTGKTMEILSRFPTLDLYGCDISDFLISKAVERGIPRDHLVVADATKLTFNDNQFDYAYSIGSLEHFTVDGIGEFLKECRRVVSKTSFHQIPTSRSGKDEGWITQGQSYYNNTVEWWLEKYQSVYDTVCTLDSIWEGGPSIGKWFLCTK